MIRLFIYGLLALGIGAWLALVLAEDPGYVLISFREYSVETTLVALFLAVVIFLVLLYALYRLFRAVNPFKWFHGDTWLGLSKKKHAIAASEEGMRLLLLGHWQDAYKQLVENADRVDTPSFNYLAASLAAWQRGDNISWNYCLEQADKKSRKANPGIKALKALLEYRTGKVEQSLAILLALDREAPGSPYVLNLLKDIYLSVRDWEKLQALLPSLEKHKVAGSGELQQLREKVSLHGLQRITLQSGGYNLLSNQWKEMDKKSRRSEEIALVYLHKLIEFSRQEEALAVVMDYLKHQWSDALVNMAGSIHGPDPARLLKQLEKLLRSRPNNAALLLSLGRVSLRNRLWGQAREYFENALRFSKTPALTAEINAELARLLDHMGEHAKSASLYGKAMALLDHKLPDLPMPD